MQQHEADAAPHHDLVVVDRRVGQEPVLKMLELENQQAHEARADGE